MKASVVYESIYGNTRQVDDATGQALSDGYEVTVAEVGPATYDALGGVDLLVVGGPTHMFGMSQGSSRDGARKALKEGPERWRARIQGVLESGSGWTNSPTP